MSNDQKTVVITGASQGIGQTTAQRFMREGWRVITCARRGLPENLERQENWRYHFQVDLQGREAVLDFIKDVRDILAGAPLHALVNNAGVSPKTPFKERLGILNGSIEGWRDVFELNFFAPLRLSRGFAGDLAKSKGAGGEYYVHRWTLRPPLRGFGLLHLQGGPIGLDAGDGG